MKKKKQKKKENGGTISCFSSSCSWPGNFSHFLLLHHPS